MSTFNDPVPLDAVLKQKPTLRENTFAMTGTIKTVTDLKSDFLAIQDLHGLDAPCCIPAGSTVESIVDWRFLRPEFRMNGDFTRTSVPKIIERER